VIRIGVGAGGNRSVAAKLRWTELFPFTAAPAVHAVGKLREDVRDLHHLTGHSPWPRQPATATQSQSARPVASFAALATFNVTGAGDCPCCMVAQPLVRVRQG
jgi:hypothetical protein